MKEQPVTAKQRTKKALMLLSFTVSLFALFLCAVVASNWLKFSSYRSLAQELNQTLGGGYKISYKWNCGIETTNCPSVRMIKDADFKTNDEAQIIFKGYERLLVSSGYESKGISICEPRAGFPIYCSLSAKKDGYAVTFNAKRDYIGVDIEP